MDMNRRLGAEFFGTFWLTFAGCGSAVLAAGFPLLGIGFLGVSLAFGLTVLTMAYAVGHISGGHFNCAVTVGLWAGGRFKTSEVLPYIMAQVVGAIAAAAVLYAIASGKPDWIPGGFAANGFGDLQSRQIRTGVVLRHRGDRDVLLSLCDHRHHLEGRGSGICRHSHRTMSDADPSVSHPGHQRIGQPGSQHRPCAVRRRRLYRAALAVLVGAVTGRDPGRSGRAVAA